MSSSEKFKPWLTCSISHDYYVRTACPVTFEPAQDTLFALKKHNILFVSQQKTQWTLLVEENFDPKDLLENECKLFFGLYPQNELFHYVSLISNTENNNFYLHDVPLSKWWKMMELNLQHIIDNKVQDISIKITSPEKYFEYVLIPKFHDANVNIKFSEERNRLTFVQGDQDFLAELGTIFPFRSEEKVKLSEDNERIKTLLWEVRDSGERLISTYIPNPKPNEISIINSKDTITSYFYF